MCVRTAEAERTDAGDRPPIVQRPRHASVGHLQREPFEGNMRIGLIEVQTRWDLTVTQRQRRLNQSGHPGRSLQVTDVGLHRSDQAATVRRATFGQDRAKGVGLDRVAQGRARAVCLDVLNAARGQARVTVGLGQHGLLRVPAGRRQTVGPTVVIGGAATQHRINLVTVGQRLTQRLQDDNAGAFAPHVSVGRRVERLTASVGCHQRRLAEVDAQRRGQDDVHAAGDGQRRFAVAQAAAGQVDGDERRRAGSVDRHARSV